jgi:hypothetical protein
MWWISVILNVVGVCVMLLAGLPVLYHLELLNNKLTVFYNLIELSHYILRVLKANWQRSGKKLHRIFLRMTVRIPNLSLTTAQQ